MRVESLTLKDFKSYQDASIDLSGLQLASVVGANGAGKSSLLEAIAFALTGARSMRNLDQFIRTGTEECRVALNFSTGGETYRLTRTRSSRGSGKSTVELARQADGLWVAEGDGTRDTEARVRQILGVDEDTLLGTAIVSQGDAGSFFALRPAQRLEALGAILKLDEQYGPIESHFKAAAAEAKAELETARRDVERLEADVERLTEKDVDLDFAVGERATYAVRVEKYERVLQEAGFALEAARRGAADSERAEAELTRLTDHRASLETRVHSLAQERDRLEIRVSDRADLEQQLADRDVIVEWLADSACAREVDQAVEADRRLAEQAIATARTRLDEATEEYRQTERRMTALAREHADATSVADRSGLEADDAERRLVVVKNADTPTCDRCGQDVGGESLRQTVAGLFAEWQTARARHAAAEQAALEKLESLQDAQAELKATSATGTERRHELEAAEAALGSLPAPAHDAIAHQRQESCLRDLDAIPARLAEIAALGERLVDVQRDVTEARDALEDPALTDTLTKAREAASGAQAALGDLRTAEQAVHGAEATLKSARATHAEADRAVARLEGEISQLAPSRDALAETTGTAKRLEQDQADAELLRKAFSKWGVPALIVGNVLLALEKEVNELLALYEGSLALRFESERETRDGARESLEIIVYDGEDWRPFETFSGGERYRVASAMRLGLAQLLSHRSGARVETLIVDEPEGLDAPGRAHLARILERMGETFGVVLLLTHYDDLKDAMPQQIVVSRGEDGLSRAEVAA